MSPSVTVTAGRSLRERREGKAESPRCCLSYYNTRFSCHPAVRRTLGCRKGLLVFQKVELSQQELTHTLTQLPTHSRCLELLHPYCGNSAWLPILFYSLLHCESTSCHLAWAHLTNVLIKDIIWELVALKLHLTAVFMRVQSTNTYKTFP
jgi:hypothetical protein